MLSGVQQFAEPASNELVVFSLKPNEKKQWVLGANVARLLGFNRGALYARYPMMTVMNINSAQKEHLVESGVVPVKHPKMAVLLKDQVEELIKRFYPSREVIFNYADPTPLPAASSSSDTAVRAAIPRKRDSPAPAPPPKRRRTAATSADYAYYNDGGPPDDDTAPSPSAHVEEVPDVEQRRPRGRPRGSLNQSTIAAAALLAAAAAEAGTEAAGVGAISAMMADEKKRESGAPTWMLGDVHLAYACTQCACCFGTRRGLRSHLLLSHRIEPTVL